MVFINTQLKLIIRNGQSPKKNPASDNLFSVFDHIFLFFQIS